jgi:hypothetical protein
MSLFKKLDSSVGVQRKGYLMHKGIRVLYFDLDDYVIQVIDNSRLPFAIRNGFKQDGTQGGTIRDFELFKSYLSSRMLSLSRDNAKMIYATFGISQRNSIDDRVDICLRCHGVSIQDSYWLAFEVGEKWEDYNIRTNSLHDIVDIALYGTYPTVAVKPSSPELTTHGLFRKAWVGECDGLYLLKSDKTDNYINTSMEVLASKVLECFNVDFVKYEGFYQEKGDKPVYVSKCKNFVTEEYDFVEACDLMEYCRRMMLSYEPTVMMYDKNFANMIILDYILMNTDRHTQNYGFLMNAQGEIVRMAPLFDFNYALVSDYLGNNVEDTLSQTLDNNESIKDLKDRYLPYSTLKFDNDKFMQLLLDSEYRKILLNVKDRIRKVGL